MAEAIQMPFGLRTWVGQRNHVLDGVQIPPWEWASLRGTGHPIVYKGHSAVICEKMAELIDWITSLLHYYGG